MADLISRAATLERMKSMAGCATCDNYNYVRCRACIWDDAMNIVEEMSEVEAVPVVHGRWIDEKGNPVPWCDVLPSSPAVSCWCNQCGTWLVASDEYPVYGLFCPACGAKMDGEG